MKMRCSGTAETHPVLYRSIYHAGLVPLGQAAIGVDQIGSFLERRAMTLTNLPQNLEITKMKTLLLTTAATLAFSTASFAETSAAELFAMSNASAAETIVRETSMGDVTTARVRLALGNMSAVERQAFFEADMIERQRILEKAVLFGDGNSAAEMAAEVEAAMTN
jgi:hypothetical protein